MAQGCAQPAVLTKSRCRRAAWSPPCPALQDNVEPLLMLADKYDMAVVRGHCCHFLANHTSAMDFKAPLDSARNVLRAASLVLQYGGNDEELAQDRQVPHRAVKERLAELWRKSSPAAICTGCNQTWQPTSDSPEKCARCSGIGTGQVRLVSSAAQAARLLELFRDPRYPTLVASVVQVGGGGRGWPYGPERDPYCWHWLVEIPGKHVLSRLVAGAIGFCASSQRAYRYLSATARDTALDLCLEHIGSMPVPHYIAALGCRSQRYPVPCQCAQRFAAFALVMSIQSPTHSAWQCFHLCLPVPHDPAPYTTLLHACAQVEVQCTIVQAFRGSVKATLPSACCSPLS